MTLFDRFLQRFRTPENGNEPENGGWTGLKKYFQFGPNDPFNDPSMAHDLAYTGDDPALLTQAEADKRFLDQCLAKAGDSLYLKGRAYFFYGVVLAAKWAGLSTWKGRV